MIRLEITRAAQTDLLEIWSYIAEDSPEAADRLILAIARTLDKMVAYPEMGRQRDDLQIPMRSCPVKGYVVYYRLVDDDCLEVYRVLHGARDTGTLRDHR